MHYKALVPTVRALSRPIFRDDNITNIVLCEKISPYKNNHYCERMTRRAFDRMNEHTSQIDACAPAVRVDIFQSGLLI